MTYNVDRYCQIFSDFAKYCPRLCNIVQNCQILPNIFQYCSNGYLSSLYSELVFDHYLLPVTCYLLLATCYLTTVTCYLLLDNCYLLHVSCYMLLAECYLLLSDTCNLIFFLYDPRLFAACYFLQKKLLPFTPVVRLALVRYY